MENKNGHKVENKDENKVENKSQKVGRRNLIRLQGAEPDRPGGDIGGVCISVKRD